MDLGPLHAQLATRTPLENKLCGIVSWTIASCRCRCHWNLEGSASEHGSQLPESHSNTGNFFPHRFLPSQKFSGAALVTERFATSVKPLCKRKKRGQHAKSNT